MKAILQKPVILLFLISPFLQNCGSGKKQEESGNSQVKTTKSLSEQTAINGLVQRYKETNDNNRPEEVVSTKIDRSHLSEIEQNYYSALDAIDSVKTLLESMDFLMSYGIKTVTSSSSSDYGQYNSTLYFDNSNDLIAFQADESAEGGTEISEFYMFEDSLVHIYYRSFSEGPWVEAVVLSDSSPIFIRRIPLEGLDGEVKEGELSDLTEWNPGEKLFAQKLSLLETYLYGKSIADFEEKDDGYYHYVESTVGESEYGGESYESSDLIISEGLLVPLLQKMMSPEFSVSSKMGTVVTKFQFDASKSTTRKNQDSGLKFRWDFEDNGTWDTSFSSNSVISHTYETTGIKSAKLEIMDNEGLKSSVIKNIEVLEAHALFTSNLVVGDVSTIFEFDASTSSTKLGSNLSFRWDFEGDGVWDTEFITDKKIKHQYKNEDVMSVRLEVKNSEGNTNIKTSQIVITKFDSLTDVDGNTYRVVKMAGKWWMMENLKVKHYNNGEDIITGLDFKAWKKTRDGAFASYDNDSANIAKYGLLYNYYTVENKSALAPKGWHVATSDEWEELGNYFERLNLVNMSDATINKKSKARNLGFLKVSGGKVNVGFGGVKFEEIDSKTYFWASSDGSNYAKYNSIEYTGSYDKNSGLSIRCVKD